MTALAGAEPRLKLVRRMITRPSAMGGEDFEGVTETVFDQKLAEDAFALHWSAHGLRYGIPVTVEDDLAAGTDLLANLSRAMLPAAQERFERFHVLLLTASREVLRTRLEARNRETAEEIERRLDRADQHVPPGVDYLEIDNSGPLKTTIAHAIDTLYPTEESS